MENNENNCNNIAIQWGFKEIDNENPNQIFGQNKYDNSS